ncbi:hypothetical protein AG1IA_08524 [Rhizoctonia solani AG-1 IA]|uniref:Uncharacterized protein n=1 Tax=Thanatephorus cucumeris (strain AG1-IA) TaxID=983506 RepID=L8WHM5_THACA|nr:hypothetical protein AG1IA_08524 [Rhizoctonia solani AG-1 IA]
MMCIRAITLHQPRTDTALLKCLTVTHGLSADSMLIPLSSVRFRLNTSTQNSSRYDRKSFSPFLITSHGALLTT